MNIANKAKKYFNENTPTYSLEPYQEVLPYLIKRNAVLLDIGCAEGRGIDYLSKEKKYRIFGLESSGAYKKLSHVKDGVYYFSILNTKKCSKLKGKFDYILMFRVLHHLVDKSISSSKELERVAIKNSLMMLKKGGVLIIKEPIFSPSIFNSLVFYVKKFLSSLSSRRITLGNYWMNIGAPLVNYFSHRSAIDFFSKYKLENIEFVRVRSNFIGKLTKRSELTVLIKN